MARLLRFCPAGFPQHIVQRGNNRGICFKNDTDFATYAKLLLEYSSKFAVAIHAWVFMTNHVHLLATPETDDGIARMMQALGRRYVPYFNAKHGRSGTLWEGRYRSNVVETETYLLNCYRYIELNPVRAGIVAEPSDYDWSSYHHNALGRNTSLCTPHPLYYALAPNEKERLSKYRALFDMYTVHDCAAEITATIKNGLALGTDRFRLEIEKKYGRRVSPSRIGRPRVKSRI